ncbi:hypothetical protein [Spirosoma areae]
MKTVLLFLLLSPAILWAQSIKITPEDAQRRQSYLLMRDGSVVQGRILGQDSLMITVRKRGGDLSFIETDQIVSISPIRPDVAVNTAEGGPETPGTVFVLKDGSRVEGNYIRRDSTMITVRKRNGQLTYFEPELLVRVDTVQTQTDMTQADALAAHTIPNRFSPWLLTGQTAYNPEKGRFYYRNIFLLVNELQYGLARNLSVGVQVNPFFGTIRPDNNARQTVFGATVRFSGKLTFPIGEQFRIGVNVSYQPKQKGYFSALPQQLVLQQLMSFGNSQRNATLGYGLRIYPDFASTNRLPFISAGVMHKISRNLTFLSDNTFYLNPSLSGNSAELSVALRFDRQRHAFDLGALALVQPYYVYYTPRQADTRAYFSPYIGYNLLIGGN